MEANSYETLTDVWRDLLYALWCSYVTYAYCSHEASDLSSDPSFH